MKIGHLVQAGDHFYSKRGQTKPHEILREIEISFER